MANALQRTLEKLHLSKPDESLPQEPDHGLVKETREKYAKAKQEHVFQYWEELDIAGRASLFDQASQIDPARINDIFTKTTQEKKEGEAHLEPLPKDATASIIDSKQDNIDIWYESGLQLVADNQVGVVLMAGGQGTRLGSSDPKGCYNIGLPSGKSLFQIQAERIIKVQELAKQKASQDAAVVPWYIMTSGPTKAPTQAVFEKHSYFGLAKENVTFFEQGILPCITTDGKIILEDKHKIAVAPDGNGGLYQALYLNSIISDMEKRGIKHIHAYCVDNCLAKVADPVFIGFAASKSVDIATKVVRKRNAQESVGLILQKNGKPEVIEYSEMDEATAQAKDGNDLLKFRAANIVNHYYSYSFLESIPQWSHRLPYHVAKKKIPYIDIEKGEKVKPEKANGIKLEQFVFDCFPFLEMTKFACLEVRREDEFSPLKNAPGTGEDDPDTSKHHILGQGKRWVEAAGGLVISEGDEGVEVSPLISYGGEGLHFLSGQEIKAPAVIEKESK